MIAVLFVALSRADPRAELRWWVRAWLANLAALTVTLAFWSWAPDHPSAWLQLVRAGYLATKTLFVMLLLQGAWALVRPGATLFSPRMLAGAFALLAVVGLVLPSLPLVGVIQHLIIAVLLTVGAVMLVRERDRGVAFLTAGFALRAVLAFAETAAYLSQLIARLPRDWGDTAGAFLSAASSVDTGAEWLIALGCVVGVAGRTQTELRQNNERLLAAQSDLRRLVDRDPLTGLDNRRGLPQLLRDAQPVGATVLFFDIDAFKRINDLHGHHVGDACLQQFAAALRDSFRPDDGVMRFGGDEFLVVAPGLDRVSAEERVERLRSRVDGADGQVPPFTFSVGTAELEPGGDPDAALQIADQRMYETKGKIPQ